MKKVLAILLALCMLLSFTACKKNNEGVTSDIGSSDTSSDSGVTVDKELMDKITAMNDTELIKYAEKLGIDTSTFEYREDLEQAVYDAAVLAGDSAIIDPEDVKDDDKTSTGTSGNTGNSGSSGNKGNSGSISNVSKNEGTSSSIDSFSKNAKFYEKKVDLKGKTIKIASPWNEWKSGGPPKQVEAAAALTQIEKDYNCKIDVVTTNSSTMLQDIATQFAAGQVYADIIEAQGNVGSLAPYVKDVSTVKSLDIKKNEWNDFIGQSTVYKGKQYGVGFMMTQSLAISHNVMYFNKDVISKYAKGTDMYKLVKDKKWTWDKMLEITKTVNQNSGGKVKGVVTQISSTIASVLYTNNVKLTKKVNNRWEFDAANDNLLRGLQFWSDYDKAGYILELSAGEDWGASEAAAFRNGQCAFMMGDYILASTYLNSYTNKYGVIPYPMGPATKDYTTLAGTKYFCLLDTDNAEAAGSVLVAMAKRTGWDMKEWDQVQLESALPDDESLEMMHLILDCDYDLSPEGIDADNLTRTCMDVIYAQSATPAEAMQSIKSTQTASIYEYFGYE